MKRYVMREYGAWSVLIVAYLAGMIAAGRATSAVIPVFFALALLANSKPSFMAWTRRASGGRPLLVFLVQVIVAAGVLVAVYGRGTTELLPLLVVPALYIAVNIGFGEHFVLTEVFGFALLALAALFSHYTVTGDLDYWLYLALVVFFGAGVFKVRVQLRKRAVDRAASVAYLILAVMLYLLAGIPVVLLVPLVDNLVFSIAPYLVRLKTLGWIEVAKSLLFLLLLALLY